MATHFSDLAVGDTLWGTTITDLYPVAHPAAEPDSPAPLLWIELADGRTGAVMAGDPIEGD